MIGRTISHYRVVAPLGSGGMGVVYRAEDVRLGREVALKFVSEDLASDPQAIRRLRSEARAASALNHGNICTIYDVGEDGGQPFIVMELMKGRSLRDHLANGPLKVHQLVDIGIEIADALHAAHSQGIIHRDIKPGNIFLTDLGHVKILDFGLAKQTPRFGESGTTMDEPDRTIAGVTRGTVSYMSPEQATGEELDGRTDLFSLGVVLYESATGRHPFPGKTSAVILSSILNRAPVAPTALNPDLPVRLQDVINNCLEKDRELRYQSAADVRADLKRVRRDIESGHSRSVDARSASRASEGGDPASVTIAASPTPTARGGAGTAGHGRSRAWVMAALLVVLLGAGWYALSFRRPPVPQPAAAAVDPVTTATITSRLGLARSSLDAGNFRAALAYASEVLALDPGHKDALIVRDKARAALGRFDSAIASARQQLDAGDVRGAARNLEAARAIDPTAPALSDLSSRLAEQIRLKDQRASSEQPSQRTRVTSAAPTSLPTRTTRKEPVDEGARPGAPTAVPPPSAPVSTPAPREDATSVTPPQPAPAKPAPVPAPSAPETSSPMPPRSGQPSATERTGAAPPAATSAPEDDAAIRRAIALYARAIESKDLALFRSVKPNLSAQDERRLQDSFRAVDRQSVEITIISVDVHGQDASVALRRKDTIKARGQQHTTESRQTMTLTRAGGRWSIVDIR